MQSGGQGSQSSANYGGRSARRGGNNNRGGGHGKGRGGNRGSYNNTACFNPGSNDGNNSISGGDKKQQKCQLSFKTGHTVITCWHKFDANFVPDTNRSAAVATASHGGGERLWYTDNGATDHITSELDKLTTHDQYNGTDQIRTTGGAGMDIKHDGSSVIHTPSHILHLNNVLHVPQAAKNLVSVHHFTKDNQTFMEFHPDFILVKDHATKKVLLRDRCRGSLYPFQHTSDPHQALSVTKPSSSRWHSHLGHPSFEVVHCVISTNNLP
jgi:hypothetical protein